MEKKAKLSFEFLISLVIYAILGEFDHAIKLSQPKLIFASRLVADRAVKISAKNAFVQKVIRIDSEAGQRASKLTISYSDLISSVKVSFSTKRKL